MNTTHALPGMPESEPIPSQSSPVVGADNLAAWPRVRRPDRAQVLLEPVCLEERLAADHQARNVWAFVERLDLSKFQDAIQARGQTPGRAATDPKLLVALWLLATIESIGSARRLEQLCQEHEIGRASCRG